MISTNLHGRLRNTNLPYTHCMLPVFEAVVNSIHAISDGGHARDGRIELRIVREPQQTLPLDRQRMGAAPLEQITDFEVVDNGVGFSDDNMESFQTLDSEYKARIGGRGVGRLLWLKAFERAKIDSTFIANDGITMRRRFDFDARDGVVNESVVGTDVPRMTKVLLKSFRPEYRERAPKSARAIANALLEHCLFYFVRQGGAPKMVVIDGPDVIDMQQLFEEYMHASSTVTEIEVRGTRFDLTHIKLQSSSQKKHFVAWCAANRVVFEDPIANKVAGLHGRIKDDDGEFVYACYVTSSYLDEHVRPERIGFDIPESDDELFAQVGPAMKEIREEVMVGVRSYLDDYLSDARAAGRRRIVEYASHRAPRYRSILPYIPEEQLWVDPEITVSELESFLHSKKFEVENGVIDEGHTILKVGDTETIEDYTRRVGAYLAKVADLNRSDLADYVTHRRVVLEILDKALERRGDGSYAREELIHQIIMPMRKTSDDVHADKCNLWLVDERLAFHDYLASDVPLSKMPIVACSDNSRPDICMLDVMDNPLLVSDDPLPATLTIIELKRPMRTDLKDDDPIAQSLEYVERIRGGGATTAKGRPIQSGADMPAFIYVLCDLNRQVQLVCEKHDLTPTKDGLGYFGYHKHYKAYIEVISFAGLVKAARERNRAFFDKLGLPTK